MVKHPKQILVQEEVNISYGFDHLKEKVEEFAKLKDPYVYYDIEGDEYYGRTVKLHFYGSRDETEEERKKRLADTRLERKQAKERKEAEKKKAEKEELELLEKLMKKHGDKL